MHKGVNVTTETIRWVIVLLLGIILSACGGGDSDDNGFTVGGAEGNTVEDEIRMGGITDSVFENGVLAVATSELSLEESSSISVAFVDESGALIDDDFTVTFTSGCVEAETSTLDSLEITATSGSGSVTYAVDEGCTGSDIITATAVIDESTFTALGTITVPEELVNSIQNVAVTPEQISISGSGGVEIAVLSFLVSDNDGDPVADQTVIFSLVNAPGGASVDASGTTNEEGIVMTNVGAGAVVSTLSVLAKIPGSEVDTIQSIPVVGGLADQAHFGIAVETHNLDAYRRFGVTTSVTAFLSDPYGGPVPDGIDVTFITDAGQIEPTCQTVNGQCSVSWTSAAPFANEPGVDTLGVDWAIAHILAYTSGNEAFVDADGDGSFGMLADGSDEESFTDLDEPFIDKNGNTTYDAGEHIDLDGSGDWTQGDGIYNGLRCNEGEASCDKTSVTIQAENYIVMSDGDNSPLISGLPASITGDTTFTLVIGDANGNPLPADTEIVITSSEGDIISSASKTTGGSDGIASMLVILDFDETATPINGYFSVTVTMPRSDYAFGPVPINIP